MMMRMIDAQHQQQTKKAAAAHRAPAADAREEHTREGSDFFGLLRGKNFVVVVD